MNSSGPHTHSSNARSYKQQQQAKRIKKLQAEMWGSSTQTRTHLHTTHTRIMAHTQNRHQYDIITTYAGGKHGAWVAARDAF